jgi:hypothetical protein
MPILLLLASALKLVVRIQMRKEGFQISYQQAVFSGINVYRVLVGGSSQQENYLEGLR